MVEIFCDGGSCCWCRLDPDLVLAGLRTLVNRARVARMFDLEFDPVICSACQGDRRREAGKVERQKVHTPGAGVRPSVNEPPPAVVDGGIAVRASAAQAAGWHKRESEANLAAAREFWSGVKRNGEVAAG